jgi:hypothetical protein
MADNIPKLGKLITEEASRDAVHVAVAPVEAAYRLRPGDHVGFLENGRVGRCENPIGVVDPFLEELLNTGDRFYLFLYPNTVTNLHHEWTHPVFDSIKETTPEKEPDVEEIDDYWGKSCSC